MDETTFKKIISQIGYSESSIQQLYSVLVQGESQSVVARRTGISRQTLSAKVKRFRKQWHYVHARETDNIDLENLIQRILTGSSYTEAK